MRSALLLFFILAVSCNRGDPIENTVKEAQAAVESRDAGKVAATLTEDFVAGSLKKEAALDELRQYLMAYQNLEVTISELKTAASEDHGSADFLATASGRVRHIGGLDQIFPESTKLRFHVTLRKEGSRWRLDSAAWTRAE